MGGQKADIAFMDPPYGIDVHMNQSDTSCKERIAGDTNTDVAVAAFNYCAALDVPTILWGANHYAADAHLPNAKCWICWDKQESNNHIDQSDCEFAWTNINSPARLFHHLWAGFRRDSEKGERRIHPTQKPVALIEEIFSHFKLPNIVLDLFGGSGSTLIACEKTGRRCFMCELSPAYTDVIIARWEQATGKKAVLSAG
jgi:site-specific DNA-methyltransferase (adenine-specific)/modification methylase